MTIEYVKPPKIDQNAIFAIWNQALFFQEIIYFFSFFLCMLGFSNNNMYYYPM